jgi:hypothetical protein
MTLNVGKKVAALQRMTVRELRTRYAEVFGEVTRAGNKAWLVKRTACPRTPQATRSNSLTLSLSSAAP